MMSTHAQQRPGDTEPAKPYVQFIDVSKAFGSHVVLDHVNFEVDRKSVV